MKPWALSLDAEGGAHVRPLFEGEPRGHRCTGKELLPGETLIECEDGAYPGKYALSSPEKRVAMDKQKEAPEAPWAADLKAMEERIMKAIEKR